MGFYVITEHIIVCSNAYNINYLNYSTHYGSVGKSLNHRLNHKCQKILPNWLNSACHSSWQGWGLSWELCLPFISPRITFARKRYSHLENNSTQNTGTNIWQERGQSAFSPQHCTVPGWWVGKKKIKRLQHFIYFTFNSCLFYTFLWNAFSRHQHKEPCEEETPGEDF